jgi:hypothetical protein
MEIHYSYTLQDFEKIAEAQYRKHPTWRRRRLGYLLLGIASLVAPFLNSRSIDHPEPFLLGLSVYGLVLVYCGLQSPGRTARKQYRNSIRPYGYTAVISPSGITTLSPTVRTELQWAAFSQSINAEEVVALVYEAVMYLFPRRAFTEDQWQEFLGLINEKLVTSGRSV